MSGLPVVLWLALVPSQVPARSGSQHAEAEVAGGEHEHGVDQPGHEAILIDWIHANDFSMIGLRPNTYDYHALCGFRRGFAYLASRGISHKYAALGRLSAQRLAPHKLLFINLVSAEREPFLVGEIEAIRSFLAQGGSLLVITDHSNCYYHAHRLKPLFAQLGIKSFTSTACEQPPRTLGSGNGWISVTRFTPHPVTRGLACLGIQTGGCVDARFALAWTSDKSWADAWSFGSYGEKNAPGFLGDFSRGPGEAAGPLGVVLAKTLERGRIVVVADQNMFSDSFINYADNYRLWLNTMAWLLHEESLRRPEDYERWQSPRIALCEQYDHAAFGSDDAEGYYYAMCLLNRAYWTFANDRSPRAADLLVLARNKDELSPRQVAELADHLRRGKNILILSAQDNVLGERQGALAQIMRELAITHPVTRLLPGRLVVETPPGEVHLLSPRVAVDNAHLAPPTRIPNVNERQRNETLLQAVRDALVRAAGAGGKGATGTPAK